MTRPQTYLFRMAVFLALVVAGAAALYPQLSDAFFANAVLNGMILAVLFLGIIFSFRQVLLLRKEIAFLAQLKRESSGGLIFPGQMTQLEAPRLLGPMARMLRERKGRITLSTLSMRTLQDGIRLRIHESHDISRYLVGLLIFLGLLGRSEGRRVGVERATGW